MKNKEKFDKTVAILVRAYLNGTLVHMNCYACAVGNIIADAMGKKYERRSREHTDEDYDDYDELVWKDEPSLYFDDNTEQIRKELWVNVISSCSGIQHKYPEKITPKLQAQFEATGYNMDELSQIEFAFEYPNNNYSADFMFNGLMAVVEVLAQIHEIDLSEVDQAKALFCKT